MQIPKPTERELIDRLLNVLRKHKGPIQLSSLIKTAELESFRKDAEEAVSYLIYRGSVRLDKDLKLNFVGESDGSGRASRGETEAPTC